MQIMAIERKINVKNNLSGVSFNSPACALKFYSSIQAMSFPPFQLLCLKTISDLG